MPKRSKQIVDAEIRQIDRLIQDGYEDRDIIRELGMPDQTFYSLKRKLYQREAEIFKKQTPDDIAYKASTLHSRLTKLHNILMKKLLSSADSTKGEMNPTRDYAATAKVAHEVMIDIYRLEAQGIQVATSEFNRHIHRLEENILPESITPINSGNPRVEPPI